MITDKNQNHSKLNYAPAQYNQRDVLSLKGVSQWTAEEEATHLQHNRILQPGFLSRPAADVVSDARLVREDWITDFCCPTVKANFMLNIAKELVLTYKVGEEELESTNHQILNKLEEIEPNIFNNIKAIADTEMNKLNQVVIRANAIQILEAKNKKLEEDKKPLITINEDAIRAMSRILVDKERRSVTDKLVDAKLKEHQAAIEKSLGLERKTVVEFGQNEDFAFLGAAGSGKSTISKQYFGDPDKGAKDKNDHVTVATDNYRAFTMPGTEAHEAKDTQDVFTRTQDVAYLVKEKVTNQLKQDRETKVARPNVIFDGVTFDNDMKTLFSDSKSVTSKVAAFTGDSPGFIGIAERADSRARDVNAAPADKGRFVNTRDLLQGHSNASSYLLTSVPTGVTTDIMSTQVERGAPAVKIGEINDKDKIVNIQNVRLFADFMNKRNINQNATNEVELLLLSNKRFSGDYVGGLATDPEMKAKSIIDMVTAAPPFKPNSYTINLQDEHGTIYATLESKDNSVRLDIKNQKIFDERSHIDKDISKPLSLEGQILAAMERQIRLGSIEKSREEALREKYSVPEKAVIQEKKEDVGTKTTWAAKVASKESPTESVQR